MKTKIHTLRALAGAALIAAPFAVPTLNTYAADSIATACSPALEKLEDLSTVKIGKSLDSLVLPVETNTTFNFYSAVPSGYKVGENKSNWESYISRMSVIQAKTKVIQKYAQHVMLSDKTCSDAVQSYVNANGFNNTKPKLQVVPANLDSLVTNWNESKFANADWTTTLTVTDDKYNLILTGGDGTALAAITKGFVVNETPDTSNANIYNALLTQTSYLTPNYGFSAIKVKMADNSSVGSSLFESLGFSRFYEKYSGQLQFSADLNRTAEAVQSSNDVFYTPVYERNIFINGVFYGVLGTLDSSSNSISYKKLANIPVLITSKSSKQTTEDQIQFINNFKNRFLASGYTLSSVTTYQNDDSTTGGVSTSGGSTDTITLDSKYQQAIKNDLQASSIEISQPYKLTLTKDGVSKTMPIWIAVVDDDAYRAYIVDSSDAKSITNETTHVSAYSLDLTGSETLKTTVLTDAQETAVKSIVKNIGKFINAYDITITPTPTLNQGVTIRMPIGSSYAKDNILAVHFVEDGDTLAKDKTYQATVVQDDGQYYAEFTVTSLSPYALVSTGLKPVTPDDVDEGTDGDTDGDTSDTNTENVPAAPGAGVLGKIVKGGVGVIAIAAGLAAIIALPFAVKRFYHKKLTMKH